MAIDVYDEQTIDAVISIVRNEIYKTQNNTKPEIDNNIKAKLKNAFISFFGKQHSEKVEQKIDNMEIHEIFQVVGDKNSLLQFLINERANTFNEGKEKYLSKPNELNYYFTTDINEILEDANTNSYCKQRLNEICDYIGIRLEDLKIPNGQATFKALVEKTYNEYLNTPYSNNPEKNRKIEFVRDYMVSYVENLKTFGFNDLESYKNDVENIGSFDPIFNKLSKNLNINFETKIKLMKGMFLPKMSMAAAQLNNKIFLGITPETPTIIHEVFHQVTDNEKSTGIDDNNGTTYFNEVVTEYFAQHINSRFLAENKDGLTNNSSNSSSEYEAYLNQYMEPFIKQYAPEFKEVLLSDDPVKAMKSIIGEQEFDIIANCCTRLFNLGHTANTIHFNNEIEKLKLENEIKINETTSGVIKKKSPIKKLINSISTNAEEIANKMNFKDSPHLQKLAGTVYKFSEILNTHTQKKVANIIDSNQSANVQEMEDDDIMSL